MIFEIGKYYSISARGKAFGYIKVLRSRRMKGYMAQVQLLWNNERTWVNRIVNDAWYKYKEVPKLIGILHLGE